jgi:hypothetical protein
MANGLFSAEYMKEHYGFEAVGENPVDPSEETKT